MSELFVPAAIVLSYIGLGAASYIGHYRYVLPKWAEIACEVWTWAFLFTFLVSFIGTFGVAYWSVHAGNHVFVDYLKWLTAIIGTDAVVHTLGGFAFFMLVVLVLWALMAIAALPVHAYYRATYRTRTSEQLRKAFILAVRH